MVYILNISALLLILDLSVPNAVSRLNSTNYAKGNKIRADVVILASLFVLMALSCFCVIVIAF